MVAVDVVHKVGLGDAGYWAHWLWALHSSSGRKGHDIKEPNGNAKAALRLGGDKQKERERSSDTTNEDEKRKDELLLPSLPEVVGVT